MDDSIWGGSLGIVNSCETTKGVASSKIFATLEKTTLWTHY